MNQKLIFEQFLEQNCTLLPHQPDVSPQRWLDRYDRKIRADEATLGFSVEETKFRGDHEQFQLDVNGSIYIITTETRSNTSMDLSFSLEGGIDEPTLDGRLELEYIGSFVQELLDRPHFISPKDGKRYVSWSEKEQRIWRLAINWINPAYNIMLAGYSLYSIPQKEPQNQEYADYFARILSVLFRNAVGLGFYTDKNCFVPDFISSWMLNMLEEIETGTVEEVN